MPRTLMRRIVFKNNDIEQRGGWLRLRDEGHRVTLTYEQTTTETSAIDTTLEAEIQVNDFDATKALLEAMGFRALRYQENYREEWKIAAVTFDPDTWPDLPTFLEVEGPDEDAVRRAAESLGLDLVRSSPRVLRPATELLPGGPDSTVWHPVGRPGTRAYPQLVCRDSVVF